MWEGVLYGERTLASTKRCLNSGLMLVQCLLHWPIIKPTQGHCLVFHDVTSFAMNNQSAAIVNTFTAL